MQYFDSICIYVISNDWSARIAEYDCFMHLFSTIKLYISTYVLPAVTPFNDIEWSIFERHFVQTSVLVAWNGCNYFEKCYYDYWTAVLKGLDIMMFRVGLICPVFSQYICSSLWSLFIWCLNTMLDTVWWMFKEKQVDRPINSI